MSKDGYEKAARGEWSGRSEWYRGDLPVVVPLPILVGSAACIRDGEDDGKQLREPECHDNSCLLPPGCYAATNQFEIDTNVWSCKFGYHVARIVQTVYENLDLAATMATTLLGETTENFKFPETGFFFPNFLISKVGTAYFVFMAGTTSIWQLLMQILQGIKVPHDQGEYSTLDLYESHAYNVLFSLLGSGASDSSRIVLIGHSYGGAVAQVIAAKLKIGNPSRRVEVLTFGAPRPGDSRLIELISSRKQIHYCVYNDPVPWVPTADPFLLTLLTIPVPEALDLFAKYARPKKIFLITKDDEIEPTTQFDGDFDTLDTFYRSAQSLVTTQPFDEHFMVNYANKLRDSCPFIDADCDLFPIAHREPVDAYLVTITGLTLTTINGTVTVDNESAVRKLDPDQMIWTKDYDGFNGGIYNPDDTTVFPDPGVFELQWVVFTVVYGAGLRIELPPYWYEGVTITAPAVTLFGTATAGGIASITIAAIDP